MLDQNESKLTVTPARKKMPLDVRIVAWLGLISAVVAFLFVGLLISGLAHIPSGHHRPILFGIISLASDLSLGIHTFWVGAGSLICAYGLIRGFKFGWWLTFIFSINGICDSLLIFSDAQVVATISICFSLGIITWLLYRRRLYKIGRNPETGK